MTTKATKKSTEKTPRPVVVTTEARGVFFGYVEDDSKAPAEITLSKVRNCIYWPTAVKGFLGLAASGPVAGSRVGPESPKTTLYKVTSISDCTPEAEKAWAAASWS